MPVHRVMKGGKPGYRYGRSGKVYTYKAGSESSRKRAKQKAHIQAYAITKSEQRHSRRERTARHRARR